MGKKKMIMMKYSAVRHGVYHSTRSLEQDWNPNPTGVRLQYNAHFAKSNEYKHMALLLFLPGHFIS